MLLQVFSATVNMGMTAQYKFGGVSETDVLDVVPFGGGRLLLVEGGSREKLSAETTVYGTTQETINLKTTAEEEVC